MFRNLWAIARHTLAQCLRMKVAVAFICLLALSLLALSMAEEGDGTLAGQIRTFLTYSLSITSLLLSLVAVVLSISVITSDVYSKRIFTVDTKPLARWQYLLGRWLGVVLLSAALLAISGGVIYGVSQHLRGGQELNGNDRRAIETEIFTARTKIRPQPLNIDSAVAKRLADMKEQGEYEKAVEVYKVRLEGNEERARQELENEIRREIGISRQSAGQGESLRWQFSGIQASGREIRGAGRVWGVVPEQLSLAIQADKALLGQLLLDAPVRIEDVDARVGRIGEGYFLATFAREDMDRAAIVRLSAGASVEIVVDPTIQIAYKISPAGQVEGEKLDSLWLIRNLSTGYQGIISRENPVQIVSVMTVPARVAQGDGSMEVVFVNMGPSGETNRPSVLITDEDIAVLFRSGGFEMNFLRGMLLILLQIMFLAAIGTLMGSFLSFPVACLVCLVALILGLGQGFLGEALALREGAFLTSDLPTTVGHYLVVAAGAVLPSFGQTSPADPIADGTYISWRQVGGGAVPALLVRSAVALAGACLIFRRRELARVQV